MDPRIVGMVTSHHSHQIDQIMMVVRKVKKSFGMVLDEDILHISMLTDHWRQILKYWKKVFLTWVFFIVALINVSGCL